MQMIKQKHTHAECILRETRAGGATHLVRVVDIGAKPYERPQHVAVPVAHGELDQVERALVELLGERRGERHRRALRRRTHAPRHFYKNWFEQQQIDSPIFVSNLGTIHN